MTMKHSRPTRATRPGSRGVMTAGALAAFAGAAVASARAQDRAWASVIDGLWTVPGNWTPVDVPDTPSENAIIAVPGSFTVTLGSSVSIGALTLASGSGRLDVSSATQLRLATGLTNHTVVTLNPFNVAADTFLSLGASWTAAGTGRIVLNAHPSNLNTANIVPATGSETLTNGPSHTISGTGAIAAPLVNHGLVRADQSGRVFLLYSGAKINNATMSAVNNATLLVSAAVSQAASGLILADGGTARFENASLAGGDLASANGGLVWINGTTTFTSVRNLGTVQVQPGVALSLDGGLFSNSGLVQVNPSGVASDCFLRLASPTAITGTGEVVLNAHPSNLNTANIVTATGTEALNNASGHTIRGTGAIAAPLTNAGRIVADQPGRVLFLYSTPKSNQAEFVAQGGGVLLLTADVAQTSGAQVRAEDTGVVQLAGTTITGGSISASGGGSVQVVASSGMTSLTTSAPIDVAPGVALSIAGPTIVQNGTIRLNPNGVASDCFLRLVSATTLSGVGSVLLNAHPSNLNTANIVPATGPEALTNGPGHTIHGTGAIAVPLTNQGVVEADASGKMLLLYSSGKTNNAVLRARDGGVLRLACSVQQGSGGRIIAADAPVQLDGATIQGGTLEAQGAGRATAVSNSTLANLATSAPIDVGSGVALSIAGSGLVNTGVVAVNPNAVASDAALRLANSTQIAGTGAVVLNAHPSNFLTSRIDSATGNEVLTNGLGHTIAGRGFILCPLVNQGILAPGLPDGPALLLGGSASLTNASAGRMDFRIFGATDRDAIQTSGVVSLGGTLRVRYGGTLAHHTGATHTLIHGALRTGEFASLDLPRGTRITYTTTDVQFLDACWADLDDGSLTGRPDGGVTIEDLVFFLRAFEAGTLEADLDDGSMNGIPDEGVTIDDLIFFLVHFEAGC